MKDIKVYVAGKVNPSSKFVDGLYWRDEFCKEISHKSGFNLISLDPTKSNGDIDFDQSNADLIVGRNNYMIKISDLVIVNLTDDISIGGSTEMIVAKYYKKPLIGLAKRNGKFIRDTKEIQGKVYENFINDS